jgi:hypothetical protein
MPRRRNHKPCRTNALARSLVTLASALVATLFWIGAVDLSPVAPVPSEPLAEVSPSGFPVSHAEFARQTISTQGQYAEAMIMSPTA